VIKIIVSVLILLGGQPVMDSQNLTYTGKTFDTQAACEAFRIGDEFAASVASLKVAILQQVVGDEVKTESRCTDTTAPDAGK
jgi:hypothetical protein